MLDEAQKLFKQLRDYADTQFALFKLETAKRVSAVVSSLMAIILVALLGFVAVLLLSLAAAYWLGSILGSVPLGLTIVGAFYILLCIIVWLSREKILRIPVMNEMIKQLFPNKEGNNQPEQEK